MKKIYPFNLNENDLEISNFEEIFIPESDYGLAKIKLNEEKNGYIVEEIPQYGGKPIIHLINSSKEVIEKIHSLIL